MRTALCEYNLGKLDQMKFYEQLADFQQFGSHHPMMKSVKCINPGAATLEYAVEEELRLLGLLMYKPRYKAAVIEEEKGKVLVYKSNVKWNVYLTIRFTFSRGADQHLLLREEIEVKAYPFIAAPFIRLLERVHRQTINQMAQHFLKA